MLCCTGDFTAVMQLLHLAAVLCCLATSSAKSINWCVISDLELQKCNVLAQRSPTFTCVRKSDTLACIYAIKAGEADATTLSGQYIYIAGHTNIDLVPIIAEYYRSANTGSCSYSVAVAKKGTAFGLKDLKGKKSCHSGLGTSDGWIFPIATLISQGSINWEGPDIAPLLEAVSHFFSASCVPGATAHNNLCQLCKGDCSESYRNEYYGNDGAFKCLSENAGEVAFMNPAHIPASEKNNYQLLCQDNTRASVEDYKTCHLGKESANAVVTRKDMALADFIWRTFSTVGGIHLFSSASYGGKNLLFNDATVHLQPIPPGTDSLLYLGVQYMDKLRLLKMGKTLSTSSIRWCAVGQAEAHKCDLWSGSTSDPDMWTIECQSAPTVEECFRKIMRNDADAVAVDAGQVYTAGKCGLVPAMVEQYDEVKCSSTGGMSVSFYYSVAVIKRGSGVTWNNLRGKRSCHTGIGQSSWNIPMGFIHSQTNTCDFTQFFRSGCAPGANAVSTFCLNCRGSGHAHGAEEKCQPRAEELYYGNTGAFRCLAEDAGDVAFIKHTTVTENTNGNGPEWAMALGSEDFELICPGKDGSVPITEYESCNLAVVPANAVVTRPDKRSKVVRILKEEQAKFGPNGGEYFRLFQSPDGNNLLFEDSTKCLRETQFDSYETFLGELFMTAMQSLRQCSVSSSDLEKSCAFQSCP